MVGDRRSRDGNCIRRFSSRLRRSRGRSAHRSRVRSSSPASCSNGSRYRGKRHVIDVSGDGPNNDGPPVTGVRDALVARGITINGLPIMIKAATGWFDLEKSSWLLRADP